MRRGAIRGLTAVMMVMLSVSGCGSSAGTDASSEASSSSSSVAGAVKASDGTVFTGRYANDYRDAYEDAKTELGKEILKDSTITDAEWQELKDAFIQCAAGVGGTVEFANAATSEHSVNYGKVSDQAVDEKSQQVHQCEMDTDFYSISAIRDFEEQDAQAGGDYLEALLSCYQRHGLADPGLTLEEYKQVMSDEGRNADMFGKYMDSSRSDYDAQGAQQFDSCNADPNS
ncbi:hypothetical protein [Pseudoscardovia radai]|uniref:hypothetical protein n=1 Tax=Pseudoscardovia radai TaxID=987066 RepID=UPI0039949157